MDLAYEVGVSPRHLSFVETGRSRASPELLLALAEHLDIPLRERNGLLLAGGYAPRYSQSPFASPEMSRVRQTLEGALALHDPYPGLVVDRYWNVVLANNAALAMTAALPDHVKGPPVNVFRASLHPDGLAAHTLNFPEWSRYLLGQLHRCALITGDAEFEALIAEVTRYPNVAAINDRRPPPPGEEPDILVPFRVDLGGGELSLFTTMTVFGTPHDVTVSELAVELFYPADKATEAILRGL
jgi:hypothetical protein